MTIPLVPLPVIDPTGRPPIELASGQTGTGIGGSGSGTAKSPGHLTFHAGERIELDSLTADLTEWAIWQRDKFDLTPWTEGRVLVDVDAAAPAGTVLELQYTLDVGGTPWEDGWAVLCSVAIDEVGTQVGEWTALPSDTAADIWLRWVTHG